MTTMGSLTSLTVVYSAVFSDADQRKHQSSASLAFVWGIHRDRWIPRTKGQLRGKCFHLMTSSWYVEEYTHRHWHYGQRLTNTCVAIGIIDTEIAVGVASPLTTWSQQPPRRSREVLVAFISLRLRHFCRISRYQFLFNHDNTQLTKIHRVWCVRPV